MSKGLPRSRTSPRMKADDMLPKTLTEAQAKAGYLLLYSAVNASNYSTARTIPYAEVYRERTSAGIETPEEHIQRAGEDQQKRERVSIR